MAKPLTRANQEFLLRLLSVFEEFRHEGKSYLAYLQANKERDEFRMRDKVVKPLFQALGYDQQKDFDPEVRTASGRVDSLIRDSMNRPLIVIETQSTQLKSFKEHRLRLFKYANEKLARFAVLSDGAHFEVYQRSETGKSWELLVQVDFPEISKSYLQKGLDGLGDEIEKLLKLRFLRKELQAKDPQLLLTEPELDVSQDENFNELLRDLRDAMELVKDDVLSQFEHLAAQAEEYERLISSDKRLQPHQARKYKKAIDFQRAFAEWQKIGNGNGREAFCTETMYVFFNRLLLIRICEDKDIVKRQISNGGIKDWMTWRGFAKFAGVNYASLLEDTYRIMNKIYTHLFQHDIFDWYVPDNNVALHVLFVFNRYNFANVDRDILGKLYERYLDREERKRLGQFYTPEEVVDYILEAVGWTPEQEIESKKLLDPACGSGGFLVRAARALVERLKRRGIAPQTILEKVRSSIYGFDINPFACHIAETNLLFQVIELIEEAKQKNLEFEMGKFNIFRTDSLRLPAEDESQAEPALFEPLGSEFAEDAQTVRQIKLRQGDFAAGFDFVVGNPPYVRQEKLKAIKGRLKRDFSRCYHGVADLYVYFYELGLRLLREGGRLGFISSNKFFRAGYGKGLRKLLGDNTLETVIDFGDLPVFDVTSYPSILIIRKGEPPEDHRVRVLKVEDLEALKGLGGYVAEHAGLLPQSYLTSAGWQLESPKLLRLVEKIRAAGTPLGEYARGKLYYGIKTGLNEAFVIDEETKERLIAEDPKSAEVIKPFLRGRDTKRYRIDYQSLYLIFTRRGIRIEDYPAIESYLAQFKEQLMPGSGRKPGNYKWFEIQDTIDYWREFEKPKIVYPDIAKACEFAVDRKSAYVDCTLFFIPFSDLYLLGLLNSKLVEFFYRQISPSIRGNFMRFKSIYVKQVPIAPALPQAKEEIAGLVDEALRINEELPEPEGLVDDLPRLVKGEGIPTQDLADTPGVTLHIPRPLGKPKLRREGRKVWLAAKADIECEDEDLAAYLELYLQALGKELRGKDSTELNRLIAVPKKPDDVRGILDKRAELLQRIEELEDRRDELDREIDERVYELYGLTEQEIRLIEENLEERKR